MLSMMFMVGLLGAGHCIGMCGGIVTALGANASKPTLLVGYNIGRILSYSLAGALAGAFSLAAVGVGGNSLELLPIMRTLAALLLILMGLYIADWWRVLVGLERVGQVIWQRIQPMAIRLGKPDRLTKAIGVGMLWGWLPCGLVYSAMGQALASGSPAKGAALMAAFGLGTLPAMLAGSWFSHHLARWLQSRSLRRLMGLIIIGMGLWMLWQIHMPSPHAHHH